ncbi:MAG: helix-turn-helix domain-containing protein [Candidatus Aenigmatarchaeota archaeon]
MVGTQQVLDTLKQIGLNLYERKLWVALLSRGTSTAGELSSLAKVPHSRTYDVLESLAEKGFVMVQTTKPLKYVAIPPMEALERAKKKINEDAGVAVERITQMQGSGTVKELEKIFKNGMSLVEPGELTGSLKGRHMLHQQMGTVFKGAKKSISIVTTATGLVDLHAKHADTLKKAAGKGVKVRIAAPVNKDTAQAVNALKEFADVKKLDKVGGRFAVVDGNHVVMALTDDKSVDPTQDLSLWTQSEHVAAEVIGPLFESMWKELSVA